MIESAFCENVVETNFLVKILIDPEKNSWNVLFKKYISDASLKSLSIIWNALPNECTVDAL